MGSANTTLGPATTAEEVASKFDDRINGKSIIVTGANIGLGMETVRVLASKGADVVLCSRNKENGEKAKDSILKIHPEAKITVMSLDLGDLNSIRTFAANFIALQRPLNILINNAGVMMCPKSKTSFVLEGTGKDTEPSRIINVASAANILFSIPSGIDFDDINSDKAYDPCIAYGKSKLANILFTNELQRRLIQDSKHVITASLHPGAIIGTNLKQHWSFSSVASMFRGLANYKSLRALAGESNKSIPQGAATQVLLALDPDVVPGAYYADCQVSEVLHPLAKDEELAEKLWIETEKIIDSAPEAPKEG